MGINHSRLEIVCCVVTFRIRCINQRNDAVRSIQAGFTALACMEETSLRYVNRSLTGKTSERKTRGVRTSILSTLQMLNMGDFESKF